MKVRDVIARVQQQVPPMRASGDRLVCGAPEQSVQAIAVTFLATQSVLWRAVEAGANLIITHEPTFYNAAEETDWLANDAISLAKRQFIAEHALAVWRFHDGCHAMRPDPIVAGMAEALGWSTLATGALANVFQIEPSSARELASVCRTRLGISSAIRIAGDLDAPITRVGLLVGAWGGRAQIELLQAPGVDAVICGESPEWETCEYVRDATVLGRSKALLVIGHANSEEAGIAWIARWVRSLVPRDIPVHYLPAGDPFQSF